MQILVITFLVAVAVAITVTPVVRQLAVRLGAIDLPDERRMHQRPTPRWGGMAIYLGFWGAVAVSALWSRSWSPVWSALLVLGTIVAVFGMIDDKRHLPAHWQMLVLLSLGVALSLFGIRIEGVTHPLAPLVRKEYLPQYWLPLGYWSLPVTALWVFVITKTVDAIDGLDGLAAGVATISAITLTLMAVLERQMEIAIASAALAGACVGFLRYNVNPASIFMGTVGAQFIGFVLATLAIAGTFKVAATVSVLVPLLVLGVPLFDAFFVVSRRLMAGEPIHKADKRHFHHWLVTKLGHRRAVIAIWGIGVMFSAAAFALYRIAR